MLLEKQEMCENNYLPVHFKILEKESKLSPSKWEKGTNKDKSRNQGNKTQIIRNLTYLEESKGGSSKNLIQFVNLY